MNRAQTFVAVIVIVAIVLSILFSPAILVAAGVILWIILWIAQGGMAEGNPYKRMAYSRAAPDFVEVKDYMIKEQIELRDRGSYETAVIIFTIGAVYIIIGSAWVLMKM
jgi:hypothetical protein